MGRGWLARWWWRSSSSLALMLTRGTGAAERTHHSERGPAIAPLMAAINTQSRSSVPCSLLTLLSAVSCSVCVFSLPRTQWRPLVTTPDSALVSPVTARHWWPGAGCRVAAPCRVDSRSGRRQLLPVLHCGCNQHLGKLFPRLCQAPSLALLHNEIW